MGYEIDPSYKEVPQRIADLKEKFPDARLQPADPASPYHVETVGNATFIVYVAACYRSADDPRPGIGVAWEPFPGKTPYTRDSELMNAETSAWGRAIVAALASESKSVASAEEVRNRQAEHVEQNQSGSGPIVQSRRSQHSTVRPAPANVHSSPNVHSDSEHAVSSEHPVFGTCNQCGGNEFWDNRDKKASGEYRPNAADGKCKNKACAKAVWLPKGDGPRLADISGGGAARPSMHVVPDPVAEAFPGSTYEDEEAPF